MELIILGSGTCIPNLKRATPGYVIKIKNDLLLFDTGSDILLQLTKARIDYREVHDIFFTHYSHPDHINGLVSLLMAKKTYWEREGILARKETINLYGPPGLIRFFKHLLKLYSEFFRTIPYKVEIEELTSSELNVFGAKIRSELVEHMHGPALAYRIISGNKSIVYSGDSDYCQNLADISKRATVLLADCSWTNQYKKKTGSTGHLSALECGKTAQEANVKKLVLTHIFPMNENFDLKREAERAFKGPVVLARDLMKIKL